MKKFISIEYQTGGCDYTIGCGVRVSDPYEAEDMEAAVKKYIAGVEEDYRYEDGTIEDNVWAGEYTPDEVEIFEVTDQYVIDVPRLRDGLEQEINEVKKKKEEAKEREELIRLQTKYGA